MVAISIITTKKYNDLLYKVQKTEVEDLNSIYGVEDSILFEENSLKKTPLDVDIDLIKSQLDADKKFDAKSGIIIYEAFKNLTPIAASNKLLWATLTHKEFKKYTINMLKILNIVINMQVFFSPIIKIILRMDGKVDFVGIYLLFVHIII